MQPHINRWPQGRPQGDTPQGCAVRQNEAALVAQGGDSELQNISSCEYTSSASRCQLIAAGRAFATCRNSVLIGLDELAAAGIALDFDLHGIIEDILADLRLIVGGRTSTADLRAEVPEHAVRAAVAHRQERARRSGGRVPA